jgi:WD40 repeat protein
VIDICFDHCGRTIVATNLGHLGVFHFESKGTSMLPLGKGSIKNAHKGSINCVETLPSGDRIVSGGKDGDIKLWKCPPVSLFF